MTTHSCIYEGIVRHRRHTPLAHDFRMPLFMMYLDLDELPALFEGMWSWSARRAALGWFRREDYIRAQDGDRHGDLAAAVRSRVAGVLGQEPSGPIRVLTHLRYFGYIFNPVSFYYCFDGAGEKVETIVAEVTNTPWKQRHAYVLDGRACPAGRSQRFEFRKAFHVSPLLPMDVGYDWRFSAPGPTLGVNMILNRGGARVFDATMAMRRREMTPAALRGLLLRYPLMTTQVVARIHIEAFRLWRRGAKFHANPESVERRRAKKLGIAPLLGPTTTGISA